MTPKLARADTIESSVEFEAGPAANNPGPRAVLRRHAPSATRQRTLEATGSTAGLVPLSKRLSSAALAPHLILQEGLTNEEGLTNAHASRVEVESPTGTGQETLAQPGRARE